MRIGLRTCNILIELKCMLLLIYSREKQQQNVIINCKRHKHTDEKYNAD